MKNILIIGGAGYVGTTLSLHLLKKGYKVTVLDNFVYDNQFAIQPFVGDENYSLHYGDLGDLKVLEEAAKDATDVVILGGLVGDPITKNYPEESDKINTRGIQRAIDYFDKKDLGRLIFVSTCSNYGLIPEDEVANEEYKLHPLSLYASAKVEAEKHLLSKKGNTNYSGVVLRFATAFGLSSRMRFDLTISEFTRDLYKGKELLVFDEHTWRPYCHVQDFARLIDLVINAPKEKVDFEVFNAGGDKNNFTKKMIVDEIVKHIPNAKVEYTEDGSDPRNYRVDFSKVKSALNFEPKFTVQDGIKELIDMLEIGFFKDSIENKEHYGNFKINYK